MQIKSRRDKGEEEVKILIRIGKALSKRWCDV